MQVLKSSSVFVFCLFILGGLDMSIANEALINEIAKCPSSPNCVSTLTKSEKHRMEPWTAESADVLEKIKKAALEIPRSKIIAESDTHLQLTFKSFIFRFVDDVWFILKDGKVHFKSASRTGYSDMGKNKERMETIEQKVF